MAANRVVGLTGACCAKGEYQQRGVDEVRQDGNASYTNGDNKGRSVYSSSQLVAPRLPQLK